MTLFNGEPLTEDEIRAREHGRVGIAVKCGRCGLTKKPIGRSAGDVAANGLCDSDCLGYYEEPKPGSLWPGESCDDFGYAHSHEATRKA